MYKSYTRSHLLNAVVVSVYYRTSSLIPNSDPYKLIKISRIITVVKPRTSLWIYVCFQNNTERVELPFGPEVKIIFRHCGHHFFRSLRISTYRVANFNIYSKYVHLCLVACLTHFEFKLKHGRHDHLGSRNSALRIWLGNFVAFNSVCIKKKVGGYRSLNSDLAFVKVFRDI